MEATFNQVSHCCNREIVVQKRTEFPLGGSRWGISFKVDVCEGCYKECSPVDQCEVCGVVGCTGSCSTMDAVDALDGIVDISEDEKE